MKTAVAVYTYVVTLSDLTHALESRVEYAEHKVILSFSLRNRAHTYMLSGTYPRDPEILIRNYFSRLGYTVLELSVTSGSVV